MFELYDSNNVYLGYISETFPNGTMFYRWLISTGVKLSKCFGSAPKYWKEQKVVITDDSMRVYKLLRHAPKSTPLVISPILNSIFTRSYIDYRVIISSTNIRKFSVKYHGLSLWNDLPREIRSAKCLAEFKRILRAHTLAHNM